MHASYSPFKGGTVWTFVAKITLNKKLKKDQEEKFIAFEGSPNKNDPLLLRTFDSLTFLSRTSLLEFLQLKLDQSPSAETKHFYNTVFQRGLSARLFNPRSKSYQALRQKMKKAKLEFAGYIVYVFHTDHKTGYVYGLVVHSNFPSKDPTNYTGQVVKFQPHISRKIHLTNGLFEFHKKSLRKIDETYTYKIKNQKRTEVIQVPVKYEIVDYVSIFPEDAFNEGVTDIIYSAGYIKKHSEKK